MAFLVVLAPNLLSILLLFWSCLLTCLLRLVSYPLTPKLLLDTVFCPGQASFLFPRILCLFGMINAFPMLHAAAMLHSNATHGFVGLPDALKLPSEKCTDSQAGFDSEK